MLEERQRGGRGLNSRGFERFNTCLDIAKEDCSDDELQPNLSSIIPHNYPYLVPPLEPGTFPAG